MNVLLLVLKVIAYVALGAFLLYLAYAHRYTKPKDDGPRCSMCGLPQWAREEACWNRNCPNERADRVEPHG